jgi:hypothetical protein
MMNQAGIRSSVKRERSSWTSDVGGEKHDFLNHTLIGFYVSESGLISHIGPVLTYLTQSNVAWSGRSHGRCPLTG